MAQVCGPVVVPSPSWPLKLTPQHSTAPPEITAQAEYSPMEMAVAPLRADTATGVPEPVVVPLPNWPEVLSPQHSTVPPESSAQAEL